MYDRLRIARVPDPYIVDNGNKTILVHPVGFAIPSSYITHRVPPKHIGVSSIIPGHREKYIASEDQYFKHIEASMFMVAYR
jgi:hypothetical protein